MNCDVLVSILSGLLIVATPFILYGLIILCCKGKMEWGFHLDVELPVFRHGLFWLITAVPIYIAFLVALNMPHDWWWEVSAEAFSIFFEEYKGVLWILSFSLAFSLGFGRLHNSKVQAERLKQFKESLNNAVVAQELTTKSIEQSEKTYEEAQRKNNFDMRYKHEDEFLKFMEKAPLDDDSPMTFNANSIVYLKLFPNNKEKLDSLTVSVDECKSCIDACSTI